MSEAETPSKKGRTRASRIDEDAPFAGIRRLSEPVQQALTYFVFGAAGSITAAARKAGVSRENLSKAMRRPDVVARMNELARERMRGPVAVLAARRVEALLNARSEEVAAKVALAVTETAGVMSRNDLRSAGASPTPLLTIVFKHAVPGEQQHQAGAETTVTVASPSSPHLREIPQPMTPRRLAAILDDERHERG